MCTVAFFAIVAQFLYWNKLGGTHVDAFTTIGSSAAAVIVNTCTCTNYHGKQIRNIKQSVQIALMLALTVLMAMHNIDFKRIACITVPLVIGYNTNAIGMHSKKTQIVGFKNFFVGALWTLWILGTTGTFPPRTWFEFAVCQSYFRYAVQLAVIHDFGNVSSDRINNVMTFPVKLGTEDALQFLSAHALISFIEAILIYQSVPLLLTAFCAFVCFLTVDLNRSKNGNRVCLALQVIPLLISLCAEMV